MADETFNRDPVGTDRALDEPEVTRAEIEMTRARMSETIDEIEGALLRKKAQIQDRLDVLAPVRERPIPSVAAALGAGLVLGLLTGGGDEERPVYADVQDDEFEDELRQAEERAATWEARARRLRKVARDQEAELEAVYRSRANGDADEEGAGMLADAAGLRDRVADGVTGFLGNITRDLFSPRR